MSDLLPVFMFVWFLWLLERGKCPEPPRPPPPVKYMDRAAERKWMPAYIKVAEARGDHTMADHYRRVLAAAQKEDA